LKQIISSLLKILISLHAQFKVSYLRDATPLNTSPEENSGRNSIRNIQPRHSRSGGSIP